MYVMKVQDVAHDAGVSDATVRRWINKGVRKDGPKLKAEKLGFRTTYVDSEEWYMFADTNGLHRKSRGGGN